MGKVAKDKLAGSPGGIGGGLVCPNKSSLKKWKG